LPAAARLAAEIGAQFQAYRATGLALDHCNAHKHYQLHPVVGRVLLSVGARFGLRAVRVPLEPARALRAVEPQHTASAAAWLSAPCGYLLRRRVRAAGLLAADQVFGLRWSGHMTTPRLAGLITHLPPGLIEIYLHPATGRYAGDAPGYQYREELSALTAPEVLAAARHQSLRRGGYGDFLPPVASAAPAASAT
jgi:chitin disaccharide deacetylase